MAKTESYQEWLQQMRNAGAQEKTKVVVLQEHEDLLQLLYLDALTPEEALIKYRNLTIAQ